MVCVGIMKPKCVPIVSVVQIFIKGLGVVELNKRYLVKNSRKHYEDVMAMIDWRKKRLKKRKPPKDFEGW